MLTATGRYISSDLTEQGGLAINNHLLVRSSVANAFSAGSFLRVYK